MTANDRHAVLVDLDGAGLPDDVYENFDLETLENQLVEALDKSGVGEYDGNEFGPETVTLFLYGPDADALFRVIEPVLTAYPLCSGARVVVRQGDPDVDGRTLTLPRT
jgi:hypothetical protein